MPSRNLAHSADKATPREGTLYSLLNQRSAAATLDLWLATVFAVTPKRAWCSWPTGRRIAVHRAGKPPQPGGRAISRSAAASRPSDV